MVHNDHVYSRFPSQFVLAADLIVGTSWIPVTQANLAGEQANTIPPVTTNEKFDVAIALLDRRTRRRLGRVRWGNWYWSANATLYTLPKFHQPGQLNYLNSSVTIDSTAALIKLTNLHIGTPGMYILNIRLVSSHGEYTIDVRSARILIYENNGKFR